MADDSTPISTSNAVAVRAAQPPQFAVVEAPVGIMDTNAFDHMKRVAKVLAMANLLPESLTHHNKQALPFEVVQARAFLVVSQASLWNADPIAIAQCTSLVHGKLCYEGKLVAALIEAKAGIVLKYEFGRYDVKKRDIVVPAEGEELNVDDRAYGVRVSNKDDPSQFIAGSVAMWHTGDKGPWQRALDWPRQLRYRGAREWARAHKPHLILGILTEDEVQDFNELALQRAVDKAGRGQKQDLVGKLKGPREGGEGFSAQHIEAETGARVIDTTAVEVNPEELKVGGEPAAETETDQGNASAAPNAEGASATSDSATAASTASQEQTAPSQPDSSSAQGDGSTAAEEPKEKPKRTRATKPEPEPAAEAEPQPEAKEKPKSKPAPEPTGDDIEDFIQTVRGFTNWGAEIKPALIMLKKSEAWREASAERQGDAMIAVIETLRELEPEKMPREDVSLFMAWLCYMVWRGKRPQGAQAIAFELDKLRHTEGYQRLSNQQRQIVENYAAECIGFVGTPSEDGE